eukprot:1148464-Pelagomonas_calceolata.AAC.2
MDVPRCDHHDGLIVPTSLKASLEDNNLTGACIPCAGPPLVYGGVLGPSKSRAMYGIRLGPEGLCSLCLGVWCLMKTVHRASNNVMHLMYHADM